MSHLDEGLIHALLDGEIPSAELPPIQAHLAACAECRARLAEEQDLLATSDRLIELIEVPALAAVSPPKRPLPVHRTWPRNLAWAATLVLAAGLGYSARGGGPSRQAVVPETTIVVRQEEPAPSRDSAPSEERAPALADRASEPAGARERRATPTSQDRADAGAKKPAVEQARVREGLDQAKAAERQPSANVAAGSALPPAGPRVVATESTTIRAANQAPAAPAPPVTAPAPRSARRLGEGQFRLEELVVTGAGEAKLGKLAAASAITFPDAIRKLGGSLRLIDGLIPDRLEAVGPVVRVVYLTGFGELVLAQQLDDGELRYTLLAPRSFPADSLETLRARIRE